MTGGRCRVALGGRFGSPFEVVAGEGTAGVERVARNTGRVGRAAGAVYPVASSGPEVSRRRRAVPGLDLGPVERHAAVAQRDVRVVADDQVIEQLDVEEPPRRERLGRQVEVVRGGCRVARRMVVDEDHAGRIEPDRVAEELPDTDERRADVALVDGRDPQHVVLRVEQHDPQLLAFEAAHLEDQPIGDVVRSADRPARRRPVGEQPAPELEGGNELGRLGLADPGHLGQLQLRRPGEPGQAVMSCQRIRGQVHSRPPARPRPPHETDQLRSREPTRTPHRKALPRSLQDRHLPDRAAALRRLASCSAECSHPNRESAPWGVEAKAGGEQESERTSRCVSEQAEPTNARIGVPRRRREGAPRPE